MIEVVDEAGAVNESRITTTRERTAQAIHYYNNNVLKARTGSKSLAYGNNAGAGGSSYSSGYHQRPQQQQQQQQQRFRGGASFNPRPLDNLYRSNSSLELLHDTNSNEYHRGIRGSGRGKLAGEYAITSTLRREYGSHGSIDVISISDQKRADGRDVSGEQFLSMLRDYKPAVLDLVSAYRGCDKKCPSSDYDTARQYHRKSADSAQIYTTTAINEQQQQQQFGVDANTSLAGTLGKATNSEQENAYAYKAANSSPKQKSKFHRFWSTGNMGSSSKNTRNDSPTEISANASFSNYIGGTNAGSGAVSGVVTGSGVSATNINLDVDEKQRRRAFAHYDCQSLIAKLGYNSRLKSLLSKRRNTTTGASAASMLGTRSLTPDGDSGGEEDGGDGRCNDLIESCPFFRNEIGGEEERIVSLTRSYSPSCSKHWKEPHHRPPLSCGVSVLEYPIGETHWTNGTCPNRRNTKIVENVDEGALYYRKYFYNQDHQNWFGLDETLGPVAVSFKREKVDAVITQAESNNHNNNNNNNSGNNPNINCSVTQLCRYRLIVRTSELQTLRGSVLEDAIPNLKPSHSLKSINTKEVLEYVIPEIQLSCLRLGMNSPQVEEQLLKLDEQGISRHYKIGVLYCRAGQATEEEMYNNEEGGPAFNEFLETIGQKVRLKGFDKYKAGLDNKSDSTGLYSIYAQYKDCEVMFHVSTMLPFTPNNRQQLLRKRHIGNDIVTIVFQEPGAQPFTPKNIRSQFQHVFIVVQAVNPCTDCTQYKIAVTRSKDVELFGPPIPKGSTLNRGKSFAEFLLAKVINGENAAHCSDKFATMATRTRQAYLKDLTLNYSTNSVLESSQKFSIIPFSSKKKERWRPRFVPDATQRGAVCWQVMLEDSTQSIIVHCFLAISADSIVLIDENTNAIVFVTPCSSVLGWLTQTNSLRLYYHEGECITMHMRESGDRDELMEVVVRLKSVTPGCPAQELSLKRNAVGQLGFHVQPDGVVTQVENMGLAWQAGLRQGGRLVEICKVAVATLTHDQMVDLLKTSLMVTVAVIPPLSDGCPRRGCSIVNCTYDSMSDDVNYEACSSPEEQKLLLHNTASLQQPIVGKHKKLYERSFSPPRSSNSSGYGTGSSNKSFNGVADKHSLLNNNHSGQPNRNASIHNNGDSLLTSFSSSQSTEDCWYDVLDTESLPLSLRSNVSPPPLPARVLSGSGGAAAAAAGSTNANRSPYKYASPSKMKLSSSLNLQSNSNSYSLPVVLDDSVIGSEYAKVRGDFIAGEKVTCLMKAEHSHKVRRMLEKKSPHPSLKVEDYSGKEDLASSLPAETLKVLSLNDGHSTDTSSTSEKAFPPSEDELSVGSGGNTSPKPKSSSTVRSTASSSTGCSRNNSPRFKDTGEPRLRPGASARSSNRNSANLTSSTLQQDLMKLINPDENRTTEERTVSQSSQQISNTVSETTTNGGVHNVALEEANSTHKSYKESAVAPQKALKPDPNSVIVTTARPATVISNSSSQSNDTFLSKEERLSLRVTSNAKHDPPCLPFPDAREMDWPSLVDTATKAMRQSSNEDNTSSLLSSSSAADDFHWIDSSNEFHFSVGSGSVESKESRKQEFQKYMSELESRLVKETQRRQSLEQEVHSLKDENRRLQQESQSAAQQLRRFTEWFFQTIDKQ